MGLRARDTDKGDKGPKVKSFLTPFERALVMLNLGAPLAIFTLMTIFFFAYCVPGEHTYARWFLEWDCRQLFPSFLLPYIVKNAGAYEAGVYNPYSMESFLSSNRTVSLFHGCLQTSAAILCYWVPAFIFGSFDMYFDSKKMWASTKIKHLGFTPRLSSTSYIKASWVAFVATSLGVVFQVLYFAPMARWINEHIYAQMLPAMLKSFAADITGSSIGDTLAWLAQQPLGGHESGQSNGWVGLAICLAKVPFTLIIVDFVFYVTHRICHEVPFLYRHVHKLHHQWVDSFAVAATAAHPFEHWFVNMHTVNLPAILLGFPVGWHTAFLCMASINTTWSHSGFHIAIPNIPAILTGGMFFVSPPPPTGKASSSSWMWKEHTPYEHDAHHHFPNCEYGTNVWCDKLFRTTWEATHKGGGSIGNDGAYRTS